MGIINNKLHLSFVLNGEIIKDNYAMCVWVYVAIHLYTYDPIVYPYLYGKLYHLNGVASFCYEYRFGVFLICHYRVN